MSHLIRRVATLLSIVIIFANCKNSHNIFTPADLEAEYFVIPVDKDTLIETKQGAIIRFPQGALHANSATVRIEIKEAYTVADMMRGGLVTRAGEKPLSSGGMIYIGAADGNASISKAVEVKIPTRYRSKRMNLYKGKEKPDGSVDWVDPEPLPTQKDEGPFAKGRDLFMANCAACHNPTTDATGPALAFLDQRRDPNWLYHFIHNSAQMIANGDPLANCIFEHYNKTAMTPFPQLSDEEIRFIFKYVNSQASNPDAFPDFQKSFDSCMAYVNLKQALAERRAELVKDNGKRVIIEMFRPGPDGIVRPNSAYEHGPLPKPENMVRPLDEDAVYYQFSIKSLGWYNVDELMNEIPGFEQCYLSAKPVDAASHINMFLLLPAHKIFLNGGLLAGRDKEYGFYTDDGKIQLPLNEKAILLAVSEDNGKLYFGKLQFITGRQQSYEVGLSPSTKEAMNDVIKKLELEGITITAQDSKNADSLRKVDFQLKDLEKLKPHNCDCGCLIGPPEPEGDTTTKEWR